MPFVHATGSADTLRQELPAGQLVQDVEPATEEYVPLEQAEQDVVPPSEAVPASQIVGSWWTKCMRGVDEPGVQCYATVPVVGLFI